MPDQKKKQNSKKARRPSSIVDMSPEERDGLLEQEKWIKEYLLLREMFPKRIPNGELATILEGTKCKTIQALRYKVKNYLKFQEQHPNKDSVLGLLKQSPGRYKKTGLTKDQQTAAIGAYCKRTRTVVRSTGEEAFIINPADISYVHQIVSLVDTHNPVSTGQIRRFLTWAQSEKPALFTLARKGKLEVERDFMPKLLNDVDGPNDRWQSDGRFLPIYVIKDGLRVSVVLVCIIDDFSRCLLDYRLIPREVKDEANEIKKIDFTSVDVRQMLADIMYRTKKRCQVFYTDNGSQYVAIKPYIERIVIDDEQAIQLIYSEGEHPWGRGKVEMFGKLVDGLLKNQPGYMYNEKDRMCRKKAKEQAGSFETFVKDFDAWKKEWNTSTEKRAVSREAIWLDEKYPSLPAPKAVDLALLAMLGEVTTRKLEDKGFQYDSQRFKIIGEDSYYRWANAVNKKVLVSSVTLNGESVVLVSLNHETWEIAVPVSEQRPSVALHQKRRRQALARFQSEQNEFMAKYDEVIQKHIGTMPKQDAITGKLIFPVVNPADANPSHEAEEDPQLIHVQASFSHPLPESQNEVRPNPAADATSTTSESASQDVKSTKRKKPEPATSNSKPKSTRSAKTQAAPAPPVTSSASNLTSETPPSEGSEPNSGKSSFLLRIHERLQAKKASENVADPGEDR